MIEAQGKHDVKEAARVQQVRAKTAGRKDPEWKQKIASRRAGTWQA